ncbi:MAG: hypothetical protein M1819_003567 [Sarea resinae]|nr:MAG: hypothetical protein M1819_003567 [Sarea resinae]
MNLYILYKLILHMKKVLALRDGEEDEGWRIEGGGCLFHVLKRMFKLINRPWKMYPLGILFGLGFDTSSEIALLGISSIQAAKGTSIWLILIFPALFTAGMCLLDTIDGALMLTLYTLPSTATTAWGGRDPITFLYYSIVLTALTVIVALAIGILQLLSMIDAVANPVGKFWDGVEVANDYYDAIGGGICGSFIIVGCLSVVLYKPWRRRMDRKRRVRQQGDQVVADEEIIGWDGSDLVPGDDVGVEGPSSWVSSKDARLPGDNKGKVVVDEVEAPVRGGQRLSWSEPSKNSGPLDH